MDDVYQKNINSFNRLTNDVNKVSSYVPYADYYPTDYPQENIQSFYPFFNQINPYNALYQNVNIKTTNEKNNAMKIESDADLIQNLTGNYLEKNNDGTNSEEKVNKKEIEISLGKIVVENIYLLEFPMINLKNIDKYNISIPENVLNKGEFFTAIKEDKEMNEIEMIDEQKTKIIIPDDYLIDINESIRNNINLFNKKEIMLFIKNQQLILKNLIEKIYEKCFNIILTIKNNIKNRGKKVKSIEAAQQLLNLIKFHNELISLFLFNNSNHNANNNNIIQDKSDNGSNTPFLTYAQYYLQNSGKTFTCEICGKIFVNYQTLGGHMSKVHPNCSEKYKKQNNTRKQREGQRKLLELVKEKLLEKYNLNYRKLKNSDEKEKIKACIKAHQKEYEILKRKIYRENVLKKEE